jgi:aspartyl/asparaginyl beta-hydroxylase (cupin superfamily)
LETVLFDKSADIEHQWLRNRDEGVAPTRGRMLCGSDPQIAISKSGTLGDKKWYRGLIG